MTSNSLTLETLQERLQAKFKRIEKTRDLAVDTALFTKKFKGMCSMCGKIGHKGKDCFSLDKNKKKKEEYYKKETNRIKTNP